ncbi:SNARE-binding exocyst subunit S6 [Glugoides intestinalis]
MDKAIFELNDKLKHPSDIEYKIDGMLNNYRKEAEILSEKKQTQYVLELEKIETIFESLKDIQDAVKSLKEQKIRSEALLKSNRYSLNEYRTIKDISVAHENFCKAKKLLENLKSPEEDPEEEDLEKYAIRIYENDEFACDLKQLGYDLTKEESRIIDRKINYLSKTSLEFTSLLLQIASEYVENINLFEKLEKIVEREEKRDALAIKVKRGEDSKDPFYTQYYLGYPRYINFEPKNLKNRIISSIVSGLRGKFDTIKNSKESNVCLSFIFDDLKQLRDNCLSFFDFNMFLIEYHMALKNFFDQKLQEKKSEDILGLIEFKSFYYFSIQKEFDRIPESLGPALIDNESVLLQQYTEITSIKLKAWIDNISSSEIQKFIARDPAMDRDENNKLVSTGFINLLQLVKAQLEPISFNERMFLFLTEVIKEKCKIFQENINHALKVEFKAVLEGKRLHGFEDYCIIFGNSGLKLTQYVSSLPFFHSDEVRELQQTFLGILKSSNNVLSDYIIFTCKPAFALLFTEEWKNRQQEVALVTIEDFLEDYCLSMSEYMLTTFICELSTKICEVYIKELGSGEIPLNSKVAELIKTDVARFIELFKKYTAENEFVDFISKVMKFSQLIEIVSGDLFIVQIKMLIMSSSDVSKSFIENILSRMNDMTKDEKEFVLAALPEIFAKKKAKKRPLMSRLLNKKP